MKGRDRFSKLIVARGVVVIGAVLALLFVIWTIAALTIALSKIDSNHATNVKITNHTLELLCRGAQDAHPNDPIIHKLCIGVKYP